MLVLWSPRLEALVLVLILVLVLVLGLVAVQLLPSVRWEEAQQRGPAALVQALLVVLVVPL